MSIRDRIGLVGFSMSALVASVALANEPRLAAGVLVMGGADPHEILAACNHEIEDARERVLARLGWSLDRFKRELEPALAGINPARFAGMVDPRRVLIIEAGADTCVPQSRPGAVVAGLRAAGTDRLSLRPPDGLPRDDLPRRA